MKKLSLMVAAVVLTTGLVKAQYPFGHPDSTVSRGIFGKDNRVEAKTRMNYNGYTMATATMVEIDKIQGDRIYCDNLKEFIIDRFGDHDFDPSVKFLDQPSAGMCTGFLIAPDIIVTAGHCITEAEDCEKYEWVFDYTSDVPYNSEEGYITIPASKRYKCKEVLATKLISGSETIDYAIIRLDRATDRVPYRFRTGLKPNLFDSVDMIGAPSGIPLKLVDNAIVTKNAESQYFVTNLDAFPGNSGGPVFNKNGFIEGILVRGPRFGDYEYDEDCDCIKPVTYSQLGLESPVGIQVQRINKIPLDVQYEALYSSLSYYLKAKNLEQLKLWLEYVWFLEVNLDSDKENLIILAARNYMPEVISLMLNSNANFNVKDIYNKPFIQFMVDNGDIANIAKAAAKKGFDINIKDDLGKNALHYAANINSSTAVIDALKNAGIELNAKDSKSQTALHIAVLNRNADMVNALIAAGANVKATDGEGKTPRQLAKAIKAKKIKKILKKAEKK